MDLEAQGIARLPNINPEEPGKVAFIQGALPGELVTYITTKQKARFEKGRVLEIHRPAVFRTQPKCQWFGKCGGCTMQHLDSRAQLSMKQRVLEDNLWHLAKIKPEIMMRPLMGPEWGYRYRARLSVVNRSIKKGTVLVGFHEAQNAYVADMTSCEVLPELISKLLPKLRDLVMSLSIRDRLPQIELAIGELDTVEKTQSLERGKPVLVFRHLLPFTQEDQDYLKTFAIEHDIWLWTQAQGPETVKPFYPQTGKLLYRLPEFGVEIPFLPTDFTQINHQMNRSLVGKAVRLLEVQKADRVLDLFCGIGNFTLPLATVAHEVVGIEGSKQLTERAMQNAKHNHLSAKVSFQCANLFEIDASTIRSWGRAERWLIDPPRDGAFALAKGLVELANSTDPDDQTFLPKRLVYVSCNPATLARDVDLLVNQARYRLLQAGVMNMFPHTSHVESMAVFERS
jgi:23S rRNA (uracil1939-C5)-methyltransferase